MGTIVCGDVGIAGGAVDTFLEHHGVKGQKWGIRNEKKTAGHSSIQVDETPWSNYKESDYSSQQWHTACLIHNHTGPSTAKSQCKLPIKTPNGVVNRHGVFSAAAVLAGSRGGVQATSEQKNAAATALLHIYEQIGAKPPPSLSVKHANVDEFLEHHGVKGQKWGIRHLPAHKVSGKTSRPMSVDAKKAEELRKKPVSSLTNKQLKTLNERKNLEQNRARLNPSKVAAGEEMAKKILGTVGVAYTVYNLATHPLTKKVASFIARQGPKQLKLF